MKKILCVCMAAILCLNFAIFVSASDQNIVNSETEKVTDSGIFEPGSKGALRIDLKTGVETHISPEELIKSANQYDKNSLSSGNTTKKSESSSRSAPTGKYRGVVIVEADTPSGDQIQSSGFLIGPNGVATSAHSIYDRNGGGWYKDIRIYTLADNGSYGEMIYASYAEIGGEYDENTRDDWGVLEIPYEPDNCYYFGLESHNGTDSLYDESVTAIGYASASGQHGDMKYYAQKISRGRVLGIVQRALLPLGTSCKAVDGMSGGPLILNSNNNAIAINKKSYSNGTEHMLINDWLYGALLSHSGR